MCGIAGIINTDKRPVDRKILWSMTDALAHRGADGRGIFADGQVGLGHRRLAVIDLSERADQPMKTEDAGLAITYNGMVYNFGELRSELEASGVKFTSGSDTEVVLKAFAKWGPASLKRFNGMFAFAAWDRKNKVITIARDRYGIKPLYYWRRGSIFLFASEVKAFIRHPQFRATLDKGALLEYFTFQNTFTNKTLFKDVTLIPPGHYMQISLKGDVRTTLKEYWDFHFREDKAIRSTEEYVEELDRLFTRAVERQLVSDVEVGSYLSGGIDTGSIVAVASRYFRELKTFCIGFDLTSASGMELSFDERAKAEHASYCYQTEHYEAVLKSGDMKKCLPELVRSLEDLRLGQSYPNFYASRLASRFVKVCLSGAGADELFAGYPWRYYKALKSRSFGEYVSGYYRYWQRLMPNSVLKELFSPIWKDVKDIRTEDIFTDVFAGHRLVPDAPQDYINHSLYFEAKTFLHGLLVVDDKLSMAQGLETRVPFLDNDLVDFALKVPVRCKLRNIDRALKINEDDLDKKNKYFKKTRDGKIILRETLSKYADKIITNQRKQGFSGPDASWFKGESIRYVKDLLLDNNAAIYGYFDHKTTKRLVEDHIEGRRNKRLFIWSLLCFEWWLRLFITGKGADAEEYAKRAEYICRP